MKIEFIEISLVSIVVCIQLYIAIKTYRDIQQFKDIIPSQKSKDIIPLHKFKVTKSLVPDSDLKKFPPEEILEKILANRYNNDIQNENSNNRTELNIIECDVEKDEEKDEEIDEEIDVFKILKSINCYLIRNWSGAIDFNLIKDIVDRNTNMIEEEINRSVGIPLYLGLMATMMGIVIALFNMPDFGLELGDIETGKKLDAGIANLISGVKIAMIASFIGLACTIVNSWFFKGSKRLSESRKNEFYTFIQIELLPVVNLGLASALELLQRSLSGFNSEFTGKLKELSEIFDENIIKAIKEQKEAFKSQTEAIKEQKELLNAIDITKISDITNYNVKVLKQLDKVLKQLDKSVAQFEKFNLYLSNVNSISNEIENVSRSISETFKNLMNEHKDLTCNEIADVGQGISATFKEVKEQISNTFGLLAEHIKNSSEYVKKFTDEEIAALEKAVSSSKNNLGNLEHLATLKADVYQFKNSSELLGEYLKKSIDDLNGNMAKSIVLLEQIEKNSISSKEKGIITSLKNLFKSKH